jgi:predicted nucleotidyltransferase
MAVIPAIDNCEQIAEWMHIARENCDQRHRLTGMLLFGSRAQSHGGIREDSDVDLLCLVDGELYGPRKAVRRVDEMTFDLCYTTVRLAKQGILQQHPQNANYILNALTEGLVLLDSDGAAEALVAAAKRVREIGPPVLKEVDRRSMQLQIEAALHRIDTLLDRSATEEDRGLVMLRCYTQFHLLFYAYCRTHRI